MATYLDFFELTQEIGTIFPGRPELDDEVMQSIRELVRYCEKDELRSMEEDIVDVDLDQWSERGLLAAAALAPRRPLPPAFAERVAA